MTRGEHTQRKDFRPSEAVSLARALEPLERKAAKQRQGTRTDKHPGNFPRSSEPQRAKDKIASAVGVDRKTLAKAEAVVIAAEREPDTFADLAEQMDGTDNVDRAFRDDPRRWHDTQRHVDGSPGHRSTTGTMPEAPHGPTRGDRSRGYRDIGDTLNASQRNAWRCVEWV